MNDLLLMLGDFAMHPVAIAVCACLVIAAGAAFATVSARAEIKCGDTHLHYRTADGQAIEQQTRELQLQWQGQTRKVRQPIGGNGQCQPTCSLAACDMNPRCARLRMGRGRVVVLQRLTTREIALIKFGAIESATADHESAAPARNNPMPHHTRAAAIWAVEYSAHRAALEAHDAS